MFAAVRDVFPWDAEIIAQNLAPEDVVEFTAQGRTPYETILASVENSAEVFAVTLNQVPVALFGTVRPNGLPDECTPWLVGATDCRILGRAILRYAPAWIDEVLAKGCRRAWNVMHCRNLVHERWVRRLGFTRGRGLTIGGEDFFYIERIDPQWEQHLSSPSSG